MNRALQCNNADTGRFFRGIVITSISLRHATSLFPNRGFNLNILKTVYTRFDMCQGLHLFWSGLANPRQHECDTLSDKNLFRWFVVGTGRLLRVTPSFNPRSIGQLSGGSVSSPLDSTRTPLASWHRCLDHCVH